MILLLDVGNSNITVGISAGNHASHNIAGQKVTAQWRLTTAHNRTTDEMGMNLVWLLENGGYSPANVTGAIISSVVPKLTYPITRAVSKYFGTEAMVVTSALKLGLLLNHPAVRELGADRLVAASAAFNLFGGNDPIIVIDYGTATTIDVIDSHGGFVTGITAPGIKISAEALFERAALLGEIELALPGSIIATNTVESLQCGILYGSIGQTEYIVNRLKAELKIPMAKTVATGGLCRVIAVGTSFDYVEPALILEGLRVIYNMNLQ
ncbi:MAG: type III pantothenate kinase [Defluviitaleaceae bacterium]|nr:type III pantothenate kinase [Defluviitaleaceae bacterium]